MIPELSINTDASDKELALIMSMVTDSKKLVFSRRSDRYGLSVERVGAGPEYDVGALTSDAQSEYCSENPSCSPIRMSAR